MRTNPRQQLLEAWRAVAKVVREKDEWVWGGRASPNSVSDAEQLLCLLWPSSEVPGFALDRPDSTQDDVLAALRALGDSRDISMLVLDAISAYLDRYSDDEGNPYFGGGSYLRPDSDDAEVTTAQKHYDVVESYSIAITFCLAAKGFAREFQRTVTRSQRRQEIDAVNLRIERRLTAAMVGLLRSFVISVIDKDSEAERSLLRTVSQGRVAGRTLLEDLQSSLEPVRSKLPELTFGLAQVTELQDYPERLFEVGWTWGVAEKAPSVDLSAGTTVLQPVGIAEPKPYLHFTVSALDGLVDLFSARTSRLGLLTSEQQPLREALQVRWSLALQYWSTLASFGDGPWPLEDIPWTTTDGENSAYYSLLIAAVVVQNLANSRGQTPDEPLTRTAVVLEELAQRGRVNRRAELGDRGISLHSPGLRIRLGGADKEGPAVVWTVADYSALLAKTAFRAAGITIGRRTRNRLLEVGDSSVEHLMRRRLAVDSAQTAGLWDDPSALFPGLDSTSAVPSWNMTERVVEVLVAAAVVAQGAPVADPALVERTRAMLAEAEHLLGQEQLSAPSDAGSQIHQLLNRVQLSLSRAAAIAAERPATAGSIVEQVLRDLDELASARQDVGRSL